jgi:ferredoxin
VDGRGVAIRGPGRAGPVQVRARADEFLLDAVERQWGPPPGSGGCRVGACSDCAALLLSGRVDQGGQSSHDEEDVAAGFVAMCVARPVSDCALLVGQEERHYAVPGAEDSVVAGRCWVAGGLVEEIATCCLADALPAGADDLRTFLRASAPASALRLRASVGEDRVVDLLLLVNALRADPGHPVWRQLEDVGRWVDLDDPATWDAVREDLLGALATHLLPLVRG